MRRVLLLLLIPLSFTSLTAQDTLSAGDKVRVTTEEERVVGYWVSLDGSQLSLNTDRDSSLELPLASLTKLEVSQGMRSDFGRGVFPGVVFGLVSALAVCAATWEVGDEFLDFGGCNGGLAAGVFLGSIVLGSIIGGAVKTESWQDVPLDRISVSLTPRGGGLEVSAEFFF